MAVVVCCFWRSNLITIRHEGRSPSHNFYDYISWGFVRSYYITSLKEDAKTVAGYIRGHWAIENSQHWVLDVTFREDESQIYADDGAINLATIRRKLLNLIKAHPLKDSVAGKMQRACWDAKFRAEILFG
jgi:predicted transposase YbfD/YdcC